MLSRERSPVLLLPFLLGNVAGVRRGESFGFDRHRPCWFPSFRRTRKARLKETKGRDWKRSFLPEAIRGGKFTPAAVKFERKRDHIKEEGTEEGQRIVKVSSYTSIGKR